MIVGYYYFSDILLVVIIILYYDTFEKFNQSAMKLFQEKE